jgi:NADPH:quinone reductase-like Zn-dependent oxidoreductase
MKAALFRQNGPPDVVEITDVPTPDPGPGQVRVAVRASSLNHLDLWVRRGIPNGPPLPHIGGSDVAGIVDAAGPGVEDGIVGTRVVVDPSLDYDWYEGEDRGEGFSENAFRLIGEHVRGGFAEQVVVPAANLVGLPTHVPFETAAAAGLVFVTAWRGLIGRGGLRAGERVLVTGASGGVGTAAVQIAQRAGAEVFAVTSGAANVERVRALGADVVYDRSTTDFSRELWKDTRKRGVHLVLDSVREPLWEACVRSLAVCGRLVTCGATAGPQAKTDLRRVFWKQLSVLGTTMGTPAEFRAVMRLVFEGMLKPVVHEVLPLDAARRAHEMLEAGRVFGKIVLVP